jgi:hypothetical protein
LDAVLARLNVIEQAQGGMSNQDRAWFLETLHREVAQLGSSLTIVSVTGTGAAAVGERAVAAGEGGVAVGGDVVYGDKVGGDKVAGGKVVASTRVRDVHGGTVITAGRVEVRAEPTGDDPDALRRAWIPTMPTHRGARAWAWPTSTPPWTPPNWNGSRARTNCGLSWLARPKPAASRPRR